MTSVKDMGLSTDDQQLVVNLADDVVTWITVQVGSYSGNWMAASAIARLKRVVYVRLGLISNSISQSYGDTCFDEWKVPDLFRSCMYTKEGLSSMVHKLKSDGTVSLDYLEFVASQAMCVSGHKWVNPCIITGRNRLSVDEWGVWDKINQVHGSRSWTLGYLSVLG